MLPYILTWFALSPILGIMVGRFIAAGRGNERAPIFLEAETRDCLNAGECADWSASVALAALDYTETAGFPCSGSGVFGRFPGVRPHAGAGDIFTPFHAEGTAREAQ